MSKRKPDIPMHAAERQKRILELLSRSGFITYQELESNLDASPATIRRDLTNLARRGELTRVHGGAQLAAPKVLGAPASDALTGTPFKKAITENIEAKRAIGRAAAALCAPGEGVMIDGGTTTYQMCAHLEPLDLQVLTNSLHIVEALLPLPGTRILVPSGTVFREQNIILAPSGEECMPRFHAPKLFMGAAAVGPEGVMQADTVLVASQRRLIDRANTVILLVDASKFQASSGAIVCELDEIDVIVTAGSAPEHAHDLAEKNGIKLIVADL